MSEESQSSNSEPRHDVERLAKAVEDPRTNSWAVTGLLLLAVLTVLHLARDLVLPVVIASILSLVFLPAVRGMKRLRIPVPLGAGIVVLALLAAFLGSVSYLAEPAGTWLARAPQSLREIEAKVRRISGSVHEVAEATEKVQDLTEQMTTGVANQKKIQEVVVKEPALVGTVFGAVKEFAITAISTLVLLYFLLACGDLFLRKTIAAMSRFSDKKRAVDIAHQVEAAVSTYLLTVAMINVGLGSAVALALYLLGVPNPILWGVMVGVLNFVPYLGDIISISVLTIVGLLTFDDLWQGLLVPGAFCLLTAAEGYILTPLIVGRRLSLNPVVIVLSVLFWVWMWGIPGALLAVPIVVALKTLCDRVDSLHVFGEFLGA
ncbi:MAG: AI-2E family transporter [Pseudomonadota bacterium]|nr:AI-2E family transporter [Pseudomonadota bacterium]